MFLGKCALHARIKVLFYSGLCAYVSCILYTLVYGKMLAKYNFCGTTAVKVALFML